MSDPVWEPLLVGEIADEARAIVADISTALVARAPSYLPGFYGDAATVLLLGECDSPALGALLEQTLTAESAGPRTVALFSGLAGTTWLLQQLVAGPELDAVLEHFDAALGQHLDAPRWEDSYDLMTGLAGVGVMLAARNDPRARRMANRVLAHLEATAIASAAGVTWRSEPPFLSEQQRARFPEGMFDLGVAHGIGGVIGMLAQFVEVDIEQERSRALLRRAVAWLLDTVPKASPRFGTAWPSDESYKRIGWCYGDLGIAGVMLLASRALGENELGSEALALLRQAIPLLEQRGAPDACFCHGAAGFAHIYNLAFQRTGDLEMRAQAVTWLERVIRMRSPGQGIGGYESLKFDGSSSRWVQDASLTTGVVGIALVIIAALEDREPPWHRLFAL